MGHGRKNHRCNKCSRHIRIPTDKKEKGLVKQDPNVQQTTIFFLWKSEVFKYTLNILEYKKY